jgi:hypothetical protein
MISKDAYELPPSITSENLYKIDVLPSIKYTYFRLSPHGGPL